MLSGRPPFGSGDGKTILARELSGAIDLAPYPEEIAEWLLRGLAPAPDERFTDAATMQRAWVAALRRMDRDARTPWWRRWLPSDDEQPLQHA